MPYEDHIVDTILKPLGMNSSSFETPSDKHAVLPIVEGNRGNYWVRKKNVNSLHTTNVPQDVQEGVQNPTGGLYSSSVDLSKFCRYILAHYNTLTTGVNWLLPGSWGTGMQNVGPLLASRFYERITDEDLSVFIVLRHAL